MNSGYERFSWATKCREILKLKISLDGEPLESVTDPLLFAKVSKRWPKIVTPLGLEPSLKTPTVTAMHSVLVEKGLIKGKSDHERSVRRVTRLVTASKMLEKAIRAGDLPRALEVIEQLPGLRKPPEK